MDDKLKSTRIPTVADVPAEFNLVPYFITGSVRYGHPTECSDLDIAIPVEHAGTLAILDSSSDRYTETVKFMHDGIVVNVIILDDVEFFSWALAARMAELSGVLDITDRWTRYQVHQMLCAVAKLSILQREHSKYYLYQKYGVFINMPSKNNSFVVDTDDIIF